MVFAIEIHVSAACDACNNPQCGIAGYQPCSTIAYAVDVRAQDGDLLVLDNAAPFYEDPIETTKSVSFSGVDSLQYSVWSSNSSYGGSYTRELPSRLC